MLSKKFIAYLSLISFSFQLFFGFAGSANAVTDTTPPSVTINVKSGQADPTTSSPVQYTVVFSEPIDTSTFTPNTLSTSGSTATGIVINSITEVAPNNGTTFEVSVSVSGIGKVLLSIPQGTGAISSVLGLTDTGPWGITIDNSGNIYTTNIGSNNISKITPSGVSTTFGTIGPYSRSITMDNSGNIYTVSSGSGNISKITPSGVSTILGTTGLTPQGIVMDNSGNIYTVSSGSGNISKITPSGVSTTFGTTGGDPLDLTIDNSGNIYTVNASDNNVSKITPSGVSTILGTTFGTFPETITIDNSGNIYASAFHTISKITPSGVSTTFGTIGGIASDMTADSLGNIYIADYATNTISKITPSGDSTVVGITGRNPKGIVRDKLGNIYVSSVLDNNVTKITPPGITDLAGNYNTASTSTDNEVNIGITELAISLNGTAIAQYVPKDAVNIKAGSVKLTAGSSGDITIQSLIVSRSGLGMATDIVPTRGIRASQSGAIISSNADYYDPVSQNATIIFSPALIIPAGTSKSIDILVNLSGSENSVHQINLTSVNAGTAFVSGAPITLGILNTTSATSPSVTINTKSGQLDPSTILPVLYTAVFSEPINVPSFTKGTLSTSGTTATGIVINSITQVAPNDGTTFEISVSAGGTGKIVLNIPQGIGTGITNLAGFYNTASTSTDNEVTIEGAPVISTNLTVHESLDQHLNTNAPSLVEAFIMSGTTYLAVPGVTTTTGSVAQIIIPSASSGTHTVAQTIENLSSDSADIITSFHYLTIGSGSYLAAGTVASGTIIYGYSGSTFEPIQRILSPKNISDFTSYTISGATYLGVAEDTFAAYGGGYSKTFRWSGTGFTEDQSFDTVANGDIEHFTIAGKDYLIVLGYNTGSIYEWKSGSGFSTFIQGIPSNGPSVKIFTIGSDTYLANMDHGYMSPFIYKWDGTQFIDFQRLPRGTTGGSKLLIEQFSHNGSTYLIFDTESRAKSTLYQFIGGKFEPVRYVDTLNYDDSASHTQWKYFTIGNESMLYLLANGYAQKNYLYKWSPLPYVVIKSPVDGIYGYPQSWNASATPISGLGTPGATLIISDGSGNVLSTGVVSGSGEFSIAVPANSGTILPIRVTPLNGVFGEKKMLNYMNITNPGTNTGGTTDTTPPIVTLIGPSTLTVYSGAIYVDSGAYWTDNIDGSGSALVGIYGSTGSFHSTGTVNTTLTGSYTIKYFKVDAAGNSGSAVRTVNVAPIITLQSSIVGTGTVTISSGTMQPGTLVITNGNLITSTNSNGYLNIPGTVNFVLSGGIWNGSLYAPIVSTGATLDIGDTGIIQNLPQDTSTTDYSYASLSTFMVGATGGTSVIASGGVFTLSIYVTSPSVSPGDTLPIFRSSDAVTWERNTPTSSCVLDTNRMCTFTTDHLSFFGFVDVTSTLIPTTALVGPGGGGGTYPSSTSIPIGIVNGTTNINTNIANDTNTINQTTGTNEEMRYGDPSTLNMFADNPPDTTAESSVISGVDTTNTENFFIPTTPVGIAYVSTKNSLRVRESASHGSSVVAYLYRNDQIEILENVDPYWSRIRYTTRDGGMNEGYIRTIYTRPPTNNDIIRSRSISFQDAWMDSTSSKGYINVARSLNLRSGPSVSHRIRTVLRPNTQVIILDTIGKWSEVITENFRGFVASRYIKSIE